MKVQKEHEHLSQLDDPKMTLVQWSETFDELIAVYGGSATLYFDAGHNNVTAFINKKPDHVTCSECRAEFKNYKKLGEHVDLTGHTTFA